MNVDGIIDNRGSNTLNLFAYCANNPINNVDLNGYLCVGALVGGIIGGIAGGLGALISGTSVTAGVVTGAATGAMIGAVCDVIATAGLSTGMSIAICSAASGVIAGAGNVANQYWNYQIDKDKKNQSYEKKNNTDNISKNMKQDNFMDYIDYDDVITSTVTAMAFAPIGYGTNSIMSCAYAGAGNSGFNLAGKFIGSTFFEINSSIGQLIIDIFFDAQ